MRSSVWVGTFCRALETHKVGLCCLTLCEAWSLGWQLGRGGKKGLNWAIKGYCFEQAVWHHTTLSCRALYRETDRMLLSLPLEWQAQVCSLYCFYSCAFPGGAAWHSLALQVWASQHMGFGFCGAEPLCGKQPTAAGVGRLANSRKCWGCSWRLLALSLRFQPPGSPSVC